MKPLIVYAGILVAVWFLLPIANRHVDHTASPPRNYFQAGDVVTLCVRYDDPVKSVPVAATYDAWLRMRKLADANDREGLQQMESEGSIAVAPSGLKVRVIDPGIFCSEIRCLDKRVDSQTMFVGTGFLVP